METKAFSTTYPDLVGCGTGTGQDVYDIIPWCFGGSIRGRSV